MLRQKNIGFFIKLGGGQVHNGIGYRIGLGGEMKLNNKLYGTVELSYAEGKRINLIGFQTHSTSSNSSRFALNAYTLNFGVSLPQTEASLNQNNVVSRNKNFTTLNIMAGTQASHNSKSNNNFNPGFMGSFSLGVDIGKGYLVPLQMDYGNLTVNYYGVESKSNSFSYSLGIAKRFESGNLNYYAKGGLGYIWDGIGYRLGTGIEVKRHKNLYYTAELNFSTGFKRSGRISQSQSVLGLTVGIGVLPFLK